MAMTGIVGQANVAYIGNQHVRGTGRYDIWINVRCGESLRICAGWQGVGEYPARKIMYIFDILAECLMKKRIATITKQR